MFSEKKIINLQKTIERNFGGNFDKKKTIGNLKGLQAAACSKHEIHHEPGMVHLTPVLLKSDG